LIEREGVNKDNRDARTPVPIIEADAVGFYQHLEKLRETQENCKIRLKPLPPYN
jgi:hypothetical protein